MLEQEIPDNLKPLLTDGRLFYGEWGRLFFASKNHLTYYDMDDVARVTLVNDNIYGRYFLQDIEPGWQRFEIMRELYRYAKPWETNLSRLSDQDLISELITLFQRDELRVWQITDGRVKLPEHFGNGSTSAADNTSTQDGGVAPAPKMKASKPGGSITTTEAPQSTAASHNPTSIEKAEEAPVINPLGPMPQRLSGLHNQEWDKVEVEKFKTRRDLDMDRLSVQDEATKEMLLDHGREGKDIEQLLSSGHDFRAKTLKAGDRLYGFDSQSNPYGTKSRASMYWMDEVTFEDMKQKFYRDGVWDREGIKNHLALPCYNRADVIDMAIVEQPHTAAVSTIGKATEQLGYTHGDYTTGMMGKIMAGGGTQITPDSSAISAVSRLTGTP